MGIRISAVKYDMYGEVIGTRIIADSVITDSPRRALSMYEDDIADDEALVYQHVDETSSAASALGRLTQEATA